MKRRNIFTSFSNSLICLLFENRSFLRVFVFPSNSPAALDLVSNSCLQIISWNENKYFPITALRIYFFMQTNIWLACRNRNDNKHSQLSSDLHYFSLLVTLIQFLQVDFCTLTPYHPVDFFEINLNCENYKIVKMSLYSPDHLSPLKYQEGLIRQCLSRWFFEFVSISIKNIQSFFDVAFASTSKFNIVSNEKKQTKRTEWNQLENKCFVSKKKTLPKVKLNWYFTTLM